MSFTFKQFFVADEECAMKVGTDGCLLGAWADVSHAMNILDIGAGCGLITLMLAQRCNANVDAVEIDEDASRQAEHNFLQSPWKERIHIIHASIVDYARECKQQFDLIVSNPPYFCNSLKAPEAKRKLARHADSLSFEQLINAAFKLCRHDGIFCVIIPYDAMQKFQGVALIAGFYLNKLTLVKVREGAEIIRVLLHFEKIKRKCPIDTIAIRDGEVKGYTDRYKELTKEFYLNF